MTSKLMSLLVFMMCSVNFYAQSFNVATYNLRYDNPGDSLDLWKNRLPVIANMIKFYDFEIFGTQEGLKHQLNGVRELLPDYSYIGVGRNDGKDGGEHAAIFYKTSRFKLLEQGNFWLSQQTDHPNKGWDAALPRICSWGKFTDRSSGLTFYMFNIHFDHVGVVARQESSRLILSKIKEMAGKTPVILTGDFNVDENNESYLLLKNSGVLSDAFDLAKVKFAPSGTFNNFDITGKPEGRIDHIFLTSGFDVQRYGILTNTYNGRYPSDHFPVMVQVSYKK